MWLFMALLFLVTGLGVGVYYFLQATHQNNQSQNSLNCQINTHLSLTQPGPSGKVDGVHVAGFKPGTKIPDLTCIDIKTGSGQAVSSTDLITVNYAGALASSGIVFDNSFDTGQAFTTGLSSVIPGWSIGLIGMKEGGIRRLLIPATLGYGTSGACKTYKADKKTCQTYAVPPNTDLVFDVQLLSISKQ
jgi:hypothetical protein